jgi:hypothetical protein
MRCMFQNAHKHGKRKQLAAPADDRSDEPNDDSDDNNHEDDEEIDDVVSLLADRSKSLGESAHDGDEIDDEEDAVDPEVLVDVDPANMERKAKMLGASKQVVMARVQRKLFQTAMKQAREDSLSEDTSNVTEQSQRLCSRPVLQ